MHGGVKEGEVENGQKRNKLEKVMIVNTEQILYDRSLSITFVMDAYFFLFVSSFLPSYQHHNSFVQDFTHNDAHILSSTTVGIKCNICSMMQQYLA